MQTALESEENRCSHSMDVFHCDHYNIDIRKEVCIERQNNGDIILKAKKQSNIHPYIYCMSCKQGKMVKQNKIKTFNVVYNDINNIETKRIETGRERIFVVVGSEYEKNKSKNSSINDSQSLRYKDGMLSKNKDNGMLSKNKDNGKTPMKNNKKSIKTKEDIIPDFPETPETPETPEIHDFPETPEIHETPEIPDIKTDKVEKNTYNGMILYENERVYECKKNNIAGGNILERLDITDIIPGNIVRVDKSTDERLFVCETCMNFDLKKEEMVLCQKTKKHPDGIKNICIKCNFLKMQNANKDNLKNESFVSKKQNAVICKSQPQQQIHDDEIEIIISFKDNTDILDYIKETAKYEFRTINQQILYMLHSNKNKK